MSAPAHRHHNAATPAEIVANYAAELSRWCAENPVIQDGDTAKDGAAIVTRGRLILADLEDERKARVRPLNEELAEINGAYKAAIKPVEIVMDELKARLTAFARAEEDRRLAEVHERERAAGEAQRRLQAATDALLEGQLYAGEGVLDIDLMERAKAAEEAARVAGLAERNLARAERDVPVRLAPGMGQRAFGLRSKEMLLIENAAAALNELGTTTDIEDAIRKSARAFRELHGRLPEGVVAITERTI